MDRETALKAVVRAMHHVWAYGSKRAIATVDGWDTGLAWCETDEARARHVDFVTQRANELVKRGSPRLDLAA